MFIGGCAGSTACGIKIFRVQLLYRFLLNQLKKIIYPRGVFVIKYDKNIIDDKTINDVKVRFQKVIDLPPKDLRKLVDNGKKELTEGVIVIFAIKDEKIGLAIGVTENLTKKYDAVKLVKIGSEIIGGKGGGGRSDFAQAGGIDSSKIDNAIDQIKSLI